MRYGLLAFGFALMTLYSFGQQSGSIGGVVTTDGAEPLPGTVVRAEGNTLPQPRETVTSANGRYRFALLPPGVYELTFTFTGMKTVKRQVKVLLAQHSILDVTMSPSSSEELVVVGRLDVIDTSSTELKSAIEAQVIADLPLGNEYRDLVKLIPGVAVTQDQVRGPSAGGSGQDNIYRFDGVDVTLPLFGTLSAVPSSHDIAQVAVVKGGAQAVGFNRAGGFLINSISKSGTNTFNGEISYKVQPDSFQADPKVPSTTLDGKTGQDWATIGFGGPLVRDRLYFYGSYYAPSTDRTDRSNVYGDLADGSKDRDEVFLKLTWSPSANLTLHGSIRDSSSESKNATVFGTSTASVSSGSETDQNILILAGDWLINADSNISFRYTDFQLDTFGRPDNLLNVVPSNAPDAFFDFDNLDQMGYVALTGLREGNPAFNQYMSPLLDRYGWADSNGTQQAGTIGGYWEINDQDFGRTAFQIAYDHYAVFGNQEHHLHVGYRHTKEPEDLTRSRNGWGIVTFLPNDFTNDDIPLEEKEFIQAEFARDEGRGVVHSEYVSDNIEINDNMTIGLWNVNVGLLLSQDELFGQDLANDSTTLSGYRLERGAKYSMYKMKWSDMVQPRMGITRTIGNGNTAFASFGWYNPPASSLPRAASWARNYQNLRTRNYFNVFGDLVRSTNVSSSSGKFFQPDMTPRRVEEVLVGYSARLDNGMVIKTTARHRYAHHFWEDTPNNSRAADGDTSPYGNVDELTSLPEYIPELSDYRNEVGGSSYVIAELDGAANKYYEVTIDAEKATDKYYIKATYTWSHYYGNFDQDGTSGGNDANLFVGSSFIADGAGRNLWDLKYGNLHGDRRHLLKMYGTYNLPWGSDLGFFAIYQSGEPWETWDVEHYRAFTGSGSSTYRNSESAGSNTSSAHQQVDLNYTHTFQFQSRYSLVFDLDIFNVLDKQTGRNIDPYFSNLTYGQPRKYWSPRRFQLAARFRF